MNETRIQAGEGQYVAEDWQTACSGTFLARKDYVRSMTIAGHIFLKHTPQ